MDKRSATIDRWLAAMGANDWESVAAFYHPDAVQEWPQTGERVVGIENITAVNEHYPGGLPGTEVKRASGVSDRFVLDAMLTPRRVRGQGDDWVVEATMDYRNGGVFEFVAILEFRGDKIARETGYWAVRGEPPAWRSQWVERTR